MKGKNLLIFIVLLCIVGGVWALGSGFKLTGVFPLGNGWSGAGGTSFTGGGYPGKVLFGAGDAYIAADGTFSGSFWLGNVGWVSFSHGLSGYETRALCPSDIFTNSTQLCPVTGSAWSQNAGWIIFGSGDVGTGSGVYYNPNTASLEGWGWNNGLGWVPLWSGLSGSTIEEAVATNTIDPLAGVPVNFISKIAIIGNIAGSRVFSVENNATINQNVGYSYQTVNHAEMLNTIRKNIAIMTRNIPDSMLSDVSSSLDFTVLKNRDLKTSLVSYITAKKRTIIVIGGDIELSDQYLNATNWGDTPIGIIALKDTNGNGGNIIIKNTVKRIYGYLYAEGTVFSGEKPSATIIPYTNAGIWAVPLNQLYIRGFVASKNTIGGSQQDPIVCPVLTPGCTVSNVHAYDWDYFRNYDATDANQGSLPSERQGIDKIKNATMIIEYDPRILSDPPPGFQELQ